MTEDNRQLKIKFERNLRKRFRANCHPDDGRKTYGGQIRFRKLC